MSEQFRIYSGSLVSGYSQKKLNSSYLNMSSKKVLMSKRTLHSSFNSREQVLVNNTYRLKDLALYILNKSKWLIVSIVGAIVSGFITVKTHLLDLFKKPVAWLERFSDNLENDV